jgi:hypothetical protein
MWYASSMQALSLDSLVGKPLTVYKDGKRREVGTIISAVYHDDHLRVVGSITDEQLHDALKAAGRV